MKLTDQQDAFGDAVWDHHHGTNAFEIIERSDGMFTISSGPEQQYGEGGRLYTAIIERTVQR